MVKQLILIERRADMSFEEFEEYWLEEHAPLVEEMPGLERYSVDVPTDPERSSRDGVAELVFEDAAAMGEAWGSEAGEAVQADAEHFAADQEVLVVEEHVQFER